MKKLLVIGVLLLTSANTALYGADSAAKRAYDQKIAAAKDAMIILELDFDDQNDIKYVINLIDIENVNRAAGIQSALSREERIQLRIVAQALAEMDEIKAEDAQTIDTYLNPPKPITQQPVAQEKSKAKEGSVEWHLEKLSEEFRKKLAMLGAAATDKTIEMYEALVKEKNKALVKIDTLLKDKKTKNKPALTNEKGALNKFIGDLNSKINELRIKRAQEVTAERQQAKAAVGTPGAASLVRKAGKSAWDRYLEIQDEINALPKAHTLGSLQRYARLVAQQEEIVASNTDVQEQLADASTMELRKIRQEISLLPKTTREARRQILRFLENLTPEFLTYPKDGKKEQINSMLDCIQVYPNTRDIHVELSIANLNALQNLTPELIVLKDMIIAYLRTSSTASLLSAPEVSQVFDIIMQQLFPEEKIAIFKEMSREQSATPQATQALRSNPQTLRAMVEKMNIQRMTTDERLNIVEQVGNSIEALRLELMQESEVDIMASNALLEHIKRIIVYNPDNITINRQATIRALDELRGLLPLMNTARDLLVVFIKVALEASRNAVETMINGLKVPQNETE